jgi:O-antigen ligase
MELTFQNLITVWNISGLVLGVVGLCWYIAGRPVFRLIALALILLVMGQIGRIPLAGTELLLLDVVMGVLWLVALLSALGKRQPILTDAFRIVTVCFFVIALVGLGLSSLGLGVGDLVRNGFYLARLIFSASLIWIIPQVFASEVAAGRLLGWLTRAGLAVVALGFVQLWVLPDIGVLAALGWDPHVGRLVSTFFDPNFLAGFLALLLSVLLARTVQEKQPFPWAAVVAVLVAGLLTYSRSGYLAIALVVAAYGLRYWWKPFLLTAAIIVPLALTIPRVNERVRGGFSLDATSRDRIDSWDRAFTVLAAFPVTGVGYNNYRDAQEQLGLIPYGDSSHSGSGSDSSLLNVYATVGLLGLMTFLLGCSLFLRRAWRLAAAGATTPQASAALALVMAAPALFLHSFFVNGWFYPFILLFGALLAGITYVGVDQRPIKSHRIVRK